MVLGVVVFSKVEVVVFFRAVVVVKGGLIEGVVVMVVDVETKDKV